MVDVFNRNDLYAWLKDKPADWSRVIAARIALRVLPFAIANSDRSGAFEFKQAVFRATAISWAASNYPAHDMKAATNAAAHAAYAATDAVADAVAQAAANAAANAAHAVARPPAHAAVHAARAAARAARAAALYTAISADLSWLASRADPNRAPRALSNRPLWPGGVEGKWLNAWHGVRNNLLKHAPSFTVWTDWYDRRIQGERAAFDIPGDQRRKEDKWLLRQIADASNKDFWDRGADHVNGQLAEWLKEARERAVQRNLENTGREGDTPTTIPAQSRAALRFGSDEEGKIVLAPSFGNQELRNDEDARDRHQLALEDAKALMQACAGSNSADRLTAMLTAYIAAAGDNVETMRPSVFVQKGERLRQESARYEDPDNFLPPLPDGIELDLKSLVKAHNMVVGLDPHLLDIDTAQTGPDDVIGDVTKPEMQGFASEAREEEILREDTADDLVEAVDLTPDGSDASDRRFRWSASSCKNLVIEAFAVALNRPGKAALATGAAALIGPGIIFGNALNTAKFLVERRKWIEEKLGRHAPTWKALFSDLCDKWDDLLDKPDE